VVRIRSWPSCVSRSAAKRLCRRSASSVHSTNPNSSDELWFQPPALAIFAVVRPTPHLSAFVSRRLRKGARDLQRFDTLIWRFVSMLLDGAVSGGTIKYE